MPCNCAIVGERQLDALVAKYIGTGKGDLTNDEREILLFALYIESEARGGLVTRSLKVAEDRLKKQQIDQGVKHG